ncbi:MAG: hypothetical protein RL217_1561 [Pseudomonadota bacterium]
MNIEIYKQQHVEILQAVHQLAQLVQGDVVAKSNEIARLLMSLRFKVKTHVAGEDKILYPRFSGKAETQAAQLLQAYQEDMQSLASGFLSFVASWEYAERIQADPARFVQEAKQALDALVKRIQRENQEFYPSIEKLAAN